MARRSGLLLLICGTLWAGPDTGAPAFEEGMKVAQGLLERGQCAEGRKRLKKLLDEHARAAYVLGRRVQIEELMRQLAFGAAVPQPDPKKIVSGELLQWNARDGTIKIRYTHATMKDWASEDGKMYVHPAAFRGPHTITIKGSRYTGTGADVFVCESPDGYIAVAAGLAGKYYAHMSSGRRGEEEPNDLTGRCESPAEGGRPYTIRVAVGETEVACSYQNKSFMRASKKRDCWGSLAFDVGGVFDEVLITGKVEPSWIQGLVDKERHERLAEFDQRWQPKDDLPEWLFEAGPVSVLDDPDPRDWPAEMDERASDIVERAIGLQQAGETSAALKMIDAAEGTLPDLVAAYLRGVLLHDLGRHEEAAASCRKVREKDPDFVPSVVVETRALMALGRGEEAFLLYRGLLARFPRAANLHADAALFLGASGRWDEANRLVGAALSNGARSEHLEATSRLVHKAVSGPPWPRRHDYESAHYVVLTDLDPKVCFEASQILEQAHAVFSNRLERAPATTEKFRVFLFSGQAGYQDHVLDLLGETVPHSAGLYVPSLRQLFIWNLPEREDMMRTVRHEGFHQYLHRIMDDPPLWFNEGLAEYFEEAKVIQGKWTTGAPRGDHLAVLKAKAPQPLRDFLFLDDRGFMGNAFANYAQAWAFMHFLLHTSRENRQLFDRFWDSFKKMPAHAEAIRAALGDRTLESLDAEFRTHVEGLRAK